MKKKKQILFYFFILLMFLPLIEMNLETIKFKPLDGAYKLTKKPDSLKYKWFSEEYQIQYDKYFNDHLGYRNFLVRLNNQIIYSLFDIVKTELTILGKNEQLFQTDYIDAYLGKNFVGEERVNNGVNELVSIQTELKKRGISFLLVFAPGKASFMPENIPDYYNLDNKQITNYDAYISRLKNTNVNYIDLRKYFSTIKDTLKAPIFPINGTHWSGYATAIATDTISKYISKLMNIKMFEQIDTGGYYTSTELRWSDNDLAKPMNVFIEKENEKMYYPNIKYISDSNTTKPNALFIGDSYVQSFYGFYPYLSTCFNPKTSYWSYNYVLKWDKGDIIKKEIFVRNLDHHKEIFTRDIVIVLVTQMNIYLLDELFLKRIYKFLKNTDTLISEAEINDRINKIKMNKEWYESLKKQAKESDEDLETVTRNNAIYYITTKRNEN